MNDRDSDSVQSMTTWRINGAENDDDRTSKTRCEGVFRSMAEQRRALPTDELFRLSKSAGFSGGEKNDSGLHRETRASVSAK